LNHFVFLYQLDGIYVQWNIKATWFERIRL